MSSQRDRHRCLISRAFSLDDRLVRNASEQILDDEQPVDDNFYDAVLFVFVSQ